MNKVLLTGIIGKHGNEVKEYGAGNSGKKNLLATFAICARTGYGENATYGYYNCVKFNVSDKFSLEPGQHVSIVGALKQNIWKDSNGKDHYDTNIIVEEIEFLPNYPKKEESKPTNSYNRSYNGYNRR